jgi:hypothetical protein
MNKDLIDARDEFHNMEKHNHRKKILVNVLFNTLLTIAVLGVLFVVYVSFFK